jgi:hypothetical protein
VLRGLLHLLGRLIGIGQLAAGPDVAPASPPIPGWTPQLFAELAWQLFDLHARRKEWRHREVETVEWRGERLYRRRASIDFTVPGRDESPNYWTALSPLTGWVVVPLSMMRKGVLHDFDIADESGHSVPVLTRAQHEAIAVGALVTLANKVIKAAGARRLDPTLVQQLVDVVRENDASLAELILTKLDQEDRRGSVEQSVADAQGYMAQRHALLCDREFKALLQDLASRYLMCVYLRGAPLERRILKFGYEDYARDLARRPPLPRRFLNSLERVGANIGWLPRVTRVRTGDPSATQSYHIEVAAPSELFIARADLTTRIDEHATIERSESMARRVHFHLREDPQHPGASPMELEVHFALDPQGFLFSVLLIAFTTFLLLFVGLIWHLNGVALRPQDTAAVVVVALPGLLAALLFRSDEDKLVAASVAGLRLIVGMLVAASLAGAGLLALNIDAQTREYWWIGVVVVAGIPAFTTAVAWQLSHYWYRVASPFRAPRPRAPPRGNGAPHDHQLPGTPRPRPGLMVGIGLPVAAVGALGLYGAIWGTWPTWAASLSNLSRSDWFGVAVVGLFGAASCGFAFVLASLWRHESPNIR